jgi:hypothetical protein
MNNHFTIIAYTLYLPITIAITIFVARNLFKNGKVFLYDIFEGNTTLADAVNNLLLVGFYLINIGYVVYMLRITGDLYDARAIFEVLSKKIGFIILLLGLIHFANMFVFFRLRKKHMESKLIN